MAASSTWHRTHRLKGKWPYSSPMILKPEENIWTFAMSMRQEQEYTISKRCSKESETSNIWSAEVVNHKRVQSLYAMKDFLQILSRAILNGLTLRNLVFGVCVCMFCCILVYGLLSFVHLTREKTFAYNNYCYEKRLEHAMHLLTTVWSSRGDPVRWTGRSSKSLTDSFL